MKFEVHLSKLQFFLKKRRQMKNKFDVTEQFERIIKLSLSPKKRNEKLMFVIR